MPVSEKFEDTANVLIFVALAEEYDQLLAELPAIGDHSDGVHVISEHQSGVSGYRIFSILATEMGDAAAHEAVQCAIERLAPNLIICVGIAGALSTDLKIGDVAVSNEIIDISQNVKIHERAVVPKRHVKGRAKRNPVQRLEQVIELSPRVLPVSLQLSASFRFVRSHPSLKIEHAKWVERAAELRLELLGADAQGLGNELQIEPSVEVGPIVSGPVVASGAFRKTLKAIDRKVLAVETESSGVFRAAKRLEIPCVTIRGISDHADINKNALERTTKNAARELASKNAVRYLVLQLNNPQFMRIAVANRDRSNSPASSGMGKNESLLYRACVQIDEYLKAMSPEYKSRPNGANLPIPRVRKQIYDGKFETEDFRPQEILESLREDRRLYIQIPKSFPNQTLAWSIAQSILKSDIDGKQILPVVFSGEEIIPPSKGVQHAAGFDLFSPDLREYFVPVIIVSEPVFHSSTRVNYLIAELSKFADPLIVVSRADSPTEHIDRLKADLFLVDHIAAPVPFKEIAGYLESAFEMTADEADSVAMRLDDTFTKFRLHTHPAYFVGLQEATIDALISANQRGELIQLAVDGLLSFAVVFDESKVKLSRTTREEFLTELVYCLKVEGLPLSRVDVEQMIVQMGQAKSLEVEAAEFLRGYFSVGLLYEFDGLVKFSVPYVEAYLLSEKLRKNPEAAKSYFDPSKDVFDYFTFDLYVERGPDSGVVDNVITFGKYVLSLCGSDPNVFLTREVRPRALATTRLLLDFAGKMTNAVNKLAATSSSSETRSEKQRLIDARNTVRGEVASRDDKRRVELPPEKKAEYERLDRLARASTLLATMVGSGAERLSGAQKVEVAGLVLPVYERFLHHWTRDRLSVNFEDVRSDLLSEESIDKLIEEFDLYDGNREEITHNLSTFIDDQEMRLLSGPAGFLLSNLAQLAGVRSLRPVFSALRPENDIERIIRDVWLMDVEHNDGKRELKKDFQQYKGSDLLRLVVTNHLMYRIFWHHWQKESKTAFAEVARYAIAPLGITTNKDHARRMLEGSRAQQT